MTEAAEEGVDAGVSEATGMAEAVATGMAEAVATGMAVAVGTGAAVGAGVAAPQAEISKARPSRVENRILFLITTSFKVDGD
jgi:hypothetical protein